MVQGIVQNAEGKALGEATVVLVPPASRRQNRALYKTATTDASGRFTIRGVAPGSYKIFAWPNVPNGAYFNGRFLAKYEDRGRTLNIDPLSTVTAEITAIPLTDR